MRITSLTAILLALTSTLSTQAADWPNWRGPSQDGSSPETGLPDKFTRADAQWTAAIPGISASVPVVTGDKVFLTAPDEAHQQLLALCYDAKTGRELWRRVVSEGSLQWDNKSNLASPSPTTDGQRVVFLFANAVAAAFDLNGKPLWSRDLSTTHGAFATQWTYGSSPLLDGGLLYIQVLQRNETFKFQDKFEKGTPGKDLSSYILALDPATGADKWKVIRPSEAVSESLEAFSSPVVHEFNGQKQLLITGGDCITGHDAATGKELWRWGTWNKEKIAHWRLVPSPVAGDGIALACAPKKNPIYAVKLGGSGHLSDSDLAWISEPREASSDVSTPAYYQGKFYVLDSDRRTLSCVEPKSGKVLWTGELGSKAKFEASPTVADGKIYMINFWGEVYVAKAGGDQFELLSMNDMGDGSKPNGDSKSCRSTISVAAGHLFIRTQDKLYCVGKK